MHGTVSPAGDKRVCDPGRIPKNLQILNAARKIFLTSGYAEATMEEIAAEAVVSKGTLYNHFDSKDNLFEALIYSEAERIAGELPTPDLEGPNPASVLRQMGLSILKVMETPATVATLRLIIGSLGRFPHLGEEFLTHSLGPRVEQVAIYLSIHDTAFDIPKQDKQAAAKQFARWCLAHVLKRVLMLPQLQQSSEDCSKWVEQMLHSITVSQSVHRNE